MPSLVIDDPVQLGERFFENSVRFTKTELQGIVYQLAEGDLRRRLETILSSRPRKEPDCGTKAYQLHRFRHIDV